MATSDDAIDAVSFEGGSAGDDVSAEGIVVIIGLPGVGKSTVGRRAARDLGWDFVDLDSLIEGRAGRTVREIFADDGEGVFRDFETDALRDVLARHVPTVVATGGGVILREANRALLSRARSVIWLTATIDDLETRLKPRAGTNRGHRPLLDGDLQSNLRRLEGERNELYEQVATEIISTDGKPFEEVLGLLVAAIGTERAS